MTAAHGKPRTSYSGDTSSPSPSPRAPGVQLLGSKRRKSRSGPLCAMELGRRAKSWPQRIPSKPGGPGRTVGSGTGLVRGVAGPGLQDAETQPETERAGLGQPEPCTAKEPLCPERGSGCAPCLGITGLRWKPSGAKP